MFAALLACAPAFAEEIPPQPEGKPIWDAEAKTWITEDALYDQLAGEDLIVIGERHGTPEHHEIEARLLYELAERGHYPALALEMLRPEQMKALNAYRAANPEYSDALGVALEWWDTGWPSFNHYAPVFQAAFALKLRIVAADLPLAEQERILAEADLEGLDADAIAHWEDAMDKAHCGLLKDDRLQQQVALQVRRDKRFVEFGQRNPTMMILGRNHLRSFSGVKRKSLALADVAQNVILTFVVETNRKSKLC